MSARRTTAIGFVCCTALLILFAGLSLSAVWQKSSTFDEPGDLFAAWRQRFLGDYTVIPEHPPLWTLLASLPLDRSSLHIEPNPEAAGVFAQLDPKRDEQIIFSALYETPGVDAERLVQHARVAMIATSVLLGILLALWSHEIGGPVAAVIALSLFAFDPGFLGHAPLIKNDAFAATALFAIAYATWRTGRAATFGNIAFLALACGTTFIVKFTALPFGPLAILLLLVRAYLPEQWTVMNRVSAHRVRAAMAIALIMATTSVVITWATYRFRFEPTSTPGVMFNDDRFLDDFRHRDIAARHPGQPGSPEEMAQWTPPFFARAVELAIRFHVMPSAWLYGLLFMRSHTLMRESYLLGHVTMFGTWWYFPFALLVKLPLGTLAAIAVAVGAAVSLSLTGRRPDLWSLLCVFVPSGALIAATLTSNLNIGIRHALPILPMAYLGIGVVAAKAMERWRAPTLVISAVLIAGTAAETLRAGPNYVAFSNAAAGGSEGGVGLLGDSNLDWGQDLPLLAQWRKSHNDRPLYASYFGFADPAAYGIDYRVMPGDPVHGRAPSPPERPAYAAISVTNLQGIYLTGATQRLYRSYLDATPIAKLGGTIYVYDLPKK